MENKIININSIFRDKSKYPNSNSFRINLEKTLKNIVYIKMTSLEMLVNNYVFTNFKNNNSFKIIVGTDTYDINIGEGNFTSSTFIIKLQDILDTINSSLSFTITADIDIATAKINLFTTPVNTITVDFSREGDTTYPGIKYHLGFTEDSYTGTEFQGDSVINLLGINYAFININDYDNLIDSRVSNIFTKIIYETGRFNSLFSQGQEFNSKDLVFRSPVDLSFLNIKMLDYMGNLLEMGEYDFSLTLEVGYIYDLALYKKINNGGSPNGDSRLLYKY